MDTFRRFSDPLTHYEDVALLSRAGRWKIIVIRIRQITDCNKVDAEDINNVNPE